MEMGKHEEKSIFKKMRSTLFRSPKLPHFFSPRVVETILVGVSLAAIAGTTFAFYGWNHDRQEFSKTHAEDSVQKEDLAKRLQEALAQLQAKEQELETLKNEDQRKKNTELQAEIKNIQTTYQQTVSSYEKLLNLRDNGAKTQPLDSQFSAVLTLLSKRNYASASATLRQLDQKIDALVAASSAEGVVPANLKVANAPPGSGYSRQAVESDVGKFVVDILTADLNSTRVQVETASAGDCRDNCPVASLSDYVARSGGFAGINGPYFCPAEYPSCAGKTNSFDTLLMNKNKVYFNSDNNVYSVVPLLVFSGNSGRLIGQSQNWGRDTGVDAVIASQPLLVSGGQVAFGGDGDPKKGSRGSRSFIGIKDNFVYIGIVRSATVAEVAHVLKTMGMQAALNLDSGGSTAFMVNGKYIAGPGRQTPFGIVLVRK
jgi:hypothetical protein